MEYGDVYQCSGCSLTFSELDAWRRQEEGRHGFDSSAMDRSRPEETLLATEQKSPASYDSSLRNA